MVVEYLNLEKRARRVLGVTNKVVVDAKELERAFRARAKETHPDLTGDSRTAEYFKLIVQAREFLGGSLDSCFLTDDSLVANFLGESVGELKGSYEKRMGARGFYDFLGVN